MGDFTKLKAWNAARELAREIHSALKGRQPGGYTGLRAQILRASSSIASNLAEGCAKQSRLELARFAEIAYASAKEVECDLILLHDAQILSGSQYESLSSRTDEVARLCYGLMRRPTNNPPNPIANAG